MKKLGIALAIAISPPSAAAHAADLPTKKEVPPPPPANCFSSLWNYLNSSRRGLPLSYAGITVYATIDVGFGYSTNGAPFNRSYANGVYSFVGKQSYGSKWLWTPNGINLSVVGINMKEAIPSLPGWSLIGALETGFDPYSGNLVNGPRSLVQNNGKALVLQSANADEPRRPFDNSAGYLGISNPTFGTLTVGRVTSLTLDSVIAYDPMGASSAFSPFGSSGSYAGFGDAETNRANTGVKYRVTTRISTAGASCSGAAMLRATARPGYIRAMSAATLPTPLAASCRWTSSAVTPRTRSASATSPAPAPRSPRAPSRASPASATGSRLLRPRRP